MHGRKEKTRHQAGLHTRVTLRIPSKTTTEEGMSPSSQPVLCSVEEVYDGFALEYKVYSCTLADPLSLAPTASFIFFGRPVRVPFQTRPNKGRTELGARLLLQHLIKVLTWHPLHPGRFYITHYLLCYGNLNNLRAPA